jgi:hypothetical protein
MSIISPPTEKPKGWLKFEEETWDEHRARIQREMPKGLTTNTQRHCPAATFFGLQRGQTGGE